jgi:O-antigen/teichoic acid export membrane protein
LSTEKQSARRRLGLLTIDQLISGASNVLIALLAARTLSAAEFGLFGIVFLVYTLLIGITRALVSDPLLVHPEESEQRPGEAIGTTCVLALPLTAILVAVGIGVSGWDARLGEALLVLSAALPLLALQDLGRYLAFATHRPMRAVVLDAVWLVLMLAAVSILIASDRRTLVWLMVAWAGSGAAAGILLFARYRVRDVQPNLAWVRFTWPLSWRYLVSYIAIQGSALGASSEVGAIAGARALGGVQGALLLARPFTTFQVAAATQAIGEVARCAADARGVWRNALVSSALTGGVGALNLLAMLVLPTALGEALLGESWDLAEPLLLPTGLYIVCIGILTGPAAALLGVKAMRKATTMNVAMGIGALIWAAIGALIDGARGAMWAAALGQSLVMVAWWLLLWIHLRQGEATSAPDVASPPEGRQSVLERA